LKDIQFLEQGYATFMLAPFSDADLFYILDGWKLSKRLMARAEESIACLMAHETIHQVLYKIEGMDTSWAFDNLSNRYKAQTSEDVTISICLNALRKIADKSGMPIWMRYMRDANAPSAHRLRNPSR
jgi:hypothetical protein